MSNERETRTFSIRAVSKAGKRMLVGRAASFNTFSRDLGGFQELLAPGCFTNALKRHDEVIFCTNHNPDLIQARTRNGSLRLLQSDGGLDFEADLPDTQAAKDLWTLVSNGTLSECSFSFTCDRDSWPDQKRLATFGGINMADLKPGMPVRLVEDLHLWDTSVVAMPAYSGGATHVGADIASVDPAATRPHWEGASVPQSVLAEARARGGRVTESRLLSEAERLEVIRAAGRLRLKIEADEATPEAIRQRARELGEQIAADDRAAELRGEK